MLFLIKLACVAFFAISMGSEISEPSLYRVPIPNFFYKSLYFSDIFLKNSDSRELRLIFDSAKKGDEDIDVQTLRSSVLHLESFFENAICDEPIFLELKDDFYFELKKIKGLFGDDLIGLDSESLPQRQDDLIYRGGNKNFKSVTCNRLSAGSIHASSDVSIGGNLSIAGSIVSRVRLNSLSPSSILSTGSNKVLTTIPYSSESLPYAVAVRDSSGTLKVSAPTESDHVATKAYVDSVVESMSVKKPVRVVSLSNTILNSEYTLNGVSLELGDRVLLVGQFDQKENGIWVVAASGWFRPDDFANGSGARSSFTFVQEGSMYADTGWICTNNSGSDIVGLNNLEFEQFSSRDSFSISNIGSGAGQIYKNFSSDSYNLRTLSSGDHLSVSTSGDEVILNLDATDANASGAVVARDGSGGFSAGDVELNSLSLSTPLSVSNGGTGVSSIASNSILIGNGTGSISVVSAGSSGTVLVGNTSSAPSFSSTPTLTGVDFGHGVFKTSGAQITLNAASSSSLNLPSAGSLTTGFFMGSGSQNLKVVCGEGSITIAESAFSGSVLLDISSLGFSTSYVAYIGSKTDINASSSIGRSVIYDYSGSTNSSLKINASIGASPGAAFNLDFGYILVGY